VHFRSKSGGFAVLCAIGSSLLGGSMMFDPQPLVGACNGRYNATPIQQLNSCSSIIKGDFSRRIRSVAYSRRGELRASEGETDDALDDFENAIRIDPDNAQAYADRGKVFLQGGKFDQAISDYEKALALKPESAEALYGRGIARLRIGDAVDGNADVAAAKAIRADIDTVFGPVEVQTPP